MGFRVAVHRGGLGGGSGCESRVPGRGSGRDRAADPHVRRVLVASRFRAAAFVVTGSHQTTGWNRERRLRIWDPAEKANAYFVFSSS